MPKISIVVPIYGVEKYIERCCKSLFRQTLSDLELIFVNDCTKDNSMSIVYKMIEENKEYLANKGYSIKIIDLQKNGGLPSARRQGIIVSTGDFVMNCDSDDWIDETMCEEMYNKAIIDNCDFVVCDYYLSDGESLKQYVKRPPYITDTKGPLWNRLSKRNLFNNIIFPTSNKAEDGAIVTQLNYYAKKRGYVSKPLYYYYVNPESMCRVFSKEACINRFEQERTNVELREAFLKSKMVEKVYKNEIVMMKHYALSNLLPFIKEKNVYLIWRNAFPEIKKQMFFSLKIPFGVRITYILTYYRLFKLLFYLKRIKE